MAGAGEGRRTTALDPETRAVATIMRTLAALDVTTQRRVIIYVSDRVLDGDAKAATVPQPPAAAGAAARDLPLA